MKKTYDFLERFIQSKGYLQNTPLTAAKFVDYASRLGLKLTLKDLERLEKDQLFFPIMRLERPVFEIEEMCFLDEKGEKRWSSSKKALKGKKIIGHRKTKGYSNYGFGTRDGEHLEALLNEGYLYSPQTRPFQPWKTFQGEMFENGNERILSFYSSYQIHWLAFLKKELKLEVDFVQVPLDNFKLEKLQNRLKELKKKIIYLKKQRKVYEKKYRMMLCLQSVYAPNGRSGSKSIQIQNDLLAWQQMRSEFDLKSVLDFMRMDIEEIAALYIEFSLELRNLLDIEQFDQGIIQLWKSIDWSVKSGSLKGKTRRALEYLQWALSLKRALSDHLGRHIFDIDEIYLGESKNIISIDPDTLKNEDFEKMRSNKRAARNTELYDPKDDKSYYHHTYKRLFYLANKLGIDYQPRLMVFVEGRTEMVAMQKFFEWRFGKPENYGIDFFNINGVSNFFGDSSKFDTQDGSGPKKLLSNFQHLISYNLNQWQIIPFVVADDEGGMAKNILEGSSLHYQGKNWPIPEPWKFVWGMDDDNLPFGGNSFELANFSDLEIIEALNDVLGISVIKSDVEELRANNKGIKHIQSGQYKDLIKSQKKVELGERLVDLSIQNYQLEDKNRVHKRPLLKVFDKIMSLSSLNHPPIHHIGELQNQNEILRALNNR